MACCQLNTKELSEVMRTACQPDPYKHISITEGLILNMQNCFKDYKRYLHILICILNLVWPKKVKLNVEQLYMLSLLHSQYMYHACWCSGDFRSQCISRHGIGPHSRNIVSNIRSANWIEHNCFMVLFCVLSRLSPVTAPTMSLTWAACGPAASISKWFTVTSQACGDIYSHRSFVIGRSQAGRISDVSYCWVWFRTAPIVDQISHKWSRIKYCSILWWSSKIPILMESNFGMKFA